MRLALSWIILRGNNLGKFSKYLIWGLAIGFFLVGINAFLKAKPASKNERVYQEVRKYSPYYLDKRVTGLDIKSKTDKEFKESPDSYEVFHRLEKLEMEWGKKHLKLDNNTLLIVDDNGTILEKFPLKNKNEIDFVHSYYGV